MTDATLPSAEDETPRFSSPRFSSQLYGQEEASMTFLRAWQSGSLPHAWLLQGMRGVGKATFAYRAARALLSRHSARADEDVASTLAAASMPSSVVFQQVQFGTHPDLAVIASEGEKEITVDQSRDLVRFLHKTPVASRYRVGIVDSADRLNREAANALLKVVEEPGRRVVLFLVCHASEALLPTLRSRCRTLLFRTIDDEKIADFLCTHGETQAIARRIAALACGSFYYAGLLADAGGENFVKAFGTALSARLTGATLKDATQQNATTFSTMLGEKAFNEKRPEAFRFLWQRFLSSAVRAETKVTNVSARASSDEALLELLSPKAREVVVRAGTTFWQGLWQRSVPHLLASRAARGGDFGLSADYALEGLREAC